MTGQTATDTKKKRGRPRIVPDLETIRKLAAMDCTDVEIAGFLGISLDTIQRWRKHHKGFQDAFASGKAHGNISLRRWQNRAAENGSAAVLIWLGKQRLGQREPKDATQSVSAEELAAALQTIGAAIAADRAGVKPNGHDTSHSALETAEAASAADRPLPE